MNIHGKPSVIVEKDKRRYDDLISRGIRAWHSDGLDPLTYNSLSMTNSNFVVVDTGSKEVDIEICKMLRKDLNHERIISMANESKIEQQLKRYDVEIVDIRRVLAATIEALIVRPTTYHALIETFEHFTVEEILITNPEINGQKVKEVALHQDVILIMAKEGESIFIPHGDTFLRTGLVLYIMGTDSALEVTRKKLG